MEFTFPQTYTLDIFRDRLTQLEAQDDRLDKKAQDNIQIVSIIFAIVGAIKLQSAQATAIDPILLGIVFVLYIVIVGLSYYILLPKRWLSPLPSSLDEMKLLTRIPEENYYRRILHTYAKAIQANESVIALKSRVLRTALALAFISFILIIVALFI